jgi:hypothetical protein
VKRANTFAVRPLSDDVERLLRDLLDASAALWNEVTYQRLMRYNDEDGFEGDVWDADTGRLEGKYKGVLGASTTQQVIRKNTEAWRGFFENKKAPSGTGELHFSHRWFAHDRPLRRGRRRHRFRLVVREGPGGDGSTGSDISARERGIPSLRQAAYTAEMATPSMDGVSLGVVSTPVAEMLDRLRALP